MGYEVIAGIGQTGVVGIFKKGIGPVVMYRANMDCNAVKEFTLYASVFPTDKKFQQVNADSTTFNSKINV